MQKRKIIILILIFVLIVAVAIVVLKLNKKSTDQQVENIAQQQEEPQVDLEKVSKEYQTKLKQIMEEYILLDAGIAAEDYDLKIKNIQSTLDKLMNLTLTKEFKQSHLELVVALDELSRVYEDGDVDLIEQADEKLNEVIGN